MLEELIAVHTAPTRRRPGSSAALKRFPARAKRALRQLIQK